MQLKKITTPHLDRVVKAAPARILQVGLKVHF
jgi:hypothetical protein